jgi:hypothetical protein
MNPTVAARLRHYTRRNRYPFRQLHPFGTVQWEGENANEVEVNEEPPSEGNQTAAAERNHECNE